MKITKLFAALVLASCASFIPLTSQAEDAGSCYSLFKIEGSEPESLEVACPKKTSRCSCVARMGDPEVHTSDTYEVWCGRKLKSRNIPSVMMVEDRTCERRF